MQSSSPILAKHGIDLFFFFFHMEFFLLVQVVFFQLTKKIRKITYFQHGRKHLEKNLYIHTVWYADQHIFLIYLFSWVTFFADKTKMSICKKVPI